MVYKDNTRQFDLNVCHNFILLRGPKTIITNIYCSTTFLYFSRCLRVLSTIFWEMQLWQMDSQILNCASTLTEFILCMYNHFLLGQWCPCGSLISKFAIWLIIFCVSHRRVGKTWGVHELCVGQGLRSGSESWPKFIVSMWNMWRLIWSFIGRCVLLSPHLSSSLSHKMQHWNGYYVDVGDVKNVQYYTYISPSLNLLQDRVCLHCHGVCLKRVFFKRRRLNSAVISSY